MLLWCTNYTVYMTCVLHGNRNTMICLAKPAFYCPTAEYVHFSIRTTLALCSTCTLHILDYIGFCCNFSRHHVLLIRCLMSPWAMHLASLDASPCAYLCLYAQPVMYTCETDSCIWHFMCIPCILIPPWAVRHGHCTATK